MDFFITLPPHLQAFLATLFTWGITALGAGMVFLFKRINKSVMDATLGFAGGVMIAAAFWSLLSPAIELASVLGFSPWLMTAAGFLCGGVLLFIGDKLFDVTEKRLEQKGARCNGSLKRCFLLIFSITLHNLPEGIAVGVSFGALTYGLDGATVAAALMLSLGIGLQNFPEGTAVSVPLLREGFSRKKAFFYGQLSGMAEPIGGLFGALLVAHARVFLPFLLSFAAGAMIYVVVEELIPESQSNQKKDLMALFTLIGFVVMMIMDVALGG
ncbi:MAG: ZIP family metal transporter [Ruminococcaceae bacterium]|nr:ZIP family metal transporter [Oscillospiraceae bacterium]